MAFNKIDIETCFKSLKIDGYKFKKEVMGFSWTKKGNSFTERIVIGYGGYPDSYNVYSPVAEIYFHDIEEVLEKFDFNERHVPTISRPFHDVQGIKYELLSTEINSDDSFDIVKKVVEKILEKGVFLFLNRFTSLQEIADFLADKKVEEIVPYIQGGILLPKTALILKTTNHPKFKDRLYEFKNILLEYSLKNNRYQILLEKFNKLFASDLEVSL